MLTKLKGRLNMVKGFGSHDAKTKSSSTYASLKNGLMAVGLQSVLVMEQISSQSVSAQSNVVMKSAMRKKPRHHRLPSMESCYLKTCYLCDRNLRPDKDVYMYRGDQGFCSIECRNRQIVLDEMRELEASSKQMRNSYSRHCSSAANRHETRLLIEEIRRRHHQPVGHDHQNHWAIIS